MRHDDAPPGVPSSPLYLLPYAIPVSMRKTSVYLTVEESARLAKLAEREGTSQAEVIRRAIRMYEPETRGDRDFSLAPSAEGPGGSISELREGELLDDFGG